MFILSKYFWFARKSPSLFRNKTLSTSFTLYAVELDKILCSQKKKKKGIKGGIGLFVQHKNDTLDASSMLHHKMAPQTLQQTDAFETLSCFSCGERVEALELENEAKRKPVMSDVLISRIIALKTYEVKCGDNILNATSKQWQYNIVLGAYME